MSRIKLDVDQMMSVASKYEEQSVMLGDVITTLDKMLVELQTYWEGTSAVRFEQNYLALKPSLIKMQDVVLDTSRAIKYTANSISEVDNVILG